MTIAVHIAVPDLLNDISSNFIYRCFTCLAEKYPSNHYIFIFDKPFSPAIITRDNITPVMAGPQIRNRMLQYYFYNFKIPRLLNKYNVDFFVSADVCSLRTKVPQCFIIKDLSFLNKKNGYSKTDARYLKKYMPVFITRSTKIAVLNPVIKNTILKLYPAIDKKLSILNIGIDKNYRAFNEKESEKIKDQFTDGRSYFLFFSDPSTADNTITMLKAFSIFKKWQQSDMQLVILSNSDKVNDIKGFSNYKYKAAVKILNLNSPETECALIASAYAAIHLPSVEISSTEGLKVLACNIPLVTSNNEFCKAIYKDGALYSDPAEKDISEKMMMLYKDENGRNELVSKGKLISRYHDWQRTSESLMQIIQPLTAL